MSAIDVSATEVIGQLAPSLANDWPGLVVDRGSGPYLYTVDGRRILDFTSGIAVANTGHCHPRVVNAIKAQAERLLHSAVGITYHLTLLELIGELTAVLPEGLDSFFFSNSGAEAVEGAIKLARYVTRRPGIIAFWGSFHGRTYGALSVTSAKSQYRRYYEPLVGAVYWAPYADPYHGVLGSVGDAAADQALGAVKELFRRVVPADQVAAVLVEPIQGEAGYIVPPQRFLSGLRKLCDEHGVFLIFDEVQTGFGRTGQMFAAQTFGVRPDIIAIAKGIGSGLPLAATVSSREVMSQWTAGSHGTTFGGNPVSCAAALETLRVIRDEGLLENCRVQGRALLEGLREVGDGHPFIGDVRGVGLMIAIEFVSRETGQPEPGLARQFREACLEKGLLLYMGGPSGEVVRLAPPLTVTAGQVAEALETMAEALDAV